jgi:hypothetical protein
MEMNFVDSFILATAFSYLAAAVLPIQFEKKMSLIFQKVVYLLCCLFLVTTLFPPYKVPPILLGILYSFMAIYCFGGRQDWGSTEHNLLMTGWDLALAICLLSKIII